MDFASWSLGLSLIVLTLAIHTTGVVLLAFKLETRIRGRGDGDEHKDERLRAIPTVIGSIAAVALILTALHGLEGVLWALAYWWLGALDSLTDASVYSLGSMTTFDIPGLALPPRFRMLSALEAVNGALLFGISTAFLFAVMQAHWLRISHRRTPPE